MMANIVVEVKRKFKGSRSGIDEKENKFFDRVSKQNPKTYDDKEDLMLLEEWIQQMENIFDMVEVLDNKCVTIKAFYLTGRADI